MTEERTREQVLFETPGDDPDFLAAIEPSTVSVLSLSPFSPECNDILGP